MVVLMVISALWCVLQLGLLASSTRTFRLGTLALGVGVGCYACGVLAIYLEVVATRAVQAVSGEPLAAVISRASYTTDPIIEEVVKLLPVLMLGALSRRHLHQRGLTDLILLGAAIGTGFALAEALLRFGSRPDRAIPDGSGGFLLIRGLGGSHIRGVPDLLTTWLPPPVSGAGFLGLGSSSTVNVHLAYTALAAAGVGWWLRSGGLKRLLGVSPFAYGCADHALYNYTVASPLRSAPGWDLVSTVRAALPVVVLIALVGATVLDQRALRRGGGAEHVLLPAERLAGVRIAGLARSAAVAPPWSLSVVQRFVLARRGFWYATARGDDPSELGEALAATAALIDRADARDRWWVAARSRFDQLPRPRALLRNWRLIVWLTLLVPSLLYLVVGADPRTAAVQRVLTAPAISVFVGVWLVFGMGYLLWQIGSGARRVRSARRLPVGEPATRSGLSLLTAVGAFGGGVGVAVNWLRAGNGTSGVVEHIHILDALGTLALIAAVFFLVAALIEVAPLIPVLAVVGGTAAGTTAVSLAAVAELGLSVAILGTTGWTLLNEASESRGPFPKMQKGTVPSTKGTDLPPETRKLVQDKLGKEWGAGWGVNKKVGNRWFDPQNSQKGSVRVDQGDPSSALPSQRVDHVIIIHEGKVIGPKGEPISGSIKTNPEAHIPLSSWLRWSKWWTP